MELDGEQVLHASVRDITERKRSEQALRQSEEQQRQLAQRLQGLLRELDHRVKNNLTNLLALVDLYVHKAGTPQELADEIRGKIMAIRWVHSLMADRQGRGVELREILERVAQQFETSDTHVSPSFDIQGTHILVAPRQVAPLAMVFQEFFANAFKHGAYQTPEGTIAIMWELGSCKTSRPCRGVRLVWTETNPSIQAPADRGVGLGLIEGLCRFELAGDCTMTFQPPGFRCEMELCLDETDKPEAD